MTPADPAALRRAVYTLMITVAFAAVCGRILAVARVYEPHLHRPDDDPNYPRPKWPATRPNPMPTLGGNDRSRWATIRALVDEGTYAIGRRETDPETGKYRDVGITMEDGWGTLDKVLHPEQQIFYSSKPPLLPTLLAGEYWLLQRLFGWTLTEDPWQVVRAILLTVNALPFVLYLALLARLAEQLGTTDWGRLYVVTAACFASFLTTFAIALNNHSVATYSALIAVYAAVQIWSDPQKGRPWHYAVAGFFAAFTVCNELPAASFAVLLTLLLFLRAPGPTLLYFAPAAALPLAGFFLTNYLAIGQLRPAYAEFNSPWYQYEGSYWRPDPAKRGIDWAGQKETKLEYAFHVLIGHHGILSLSPILLFAAAGMVWGLFRRGADADARRGPVLQTLATLTLFLSVVVTGFYLLQTSNYGGWTSGLRWLFWLTPFWLLCMLPVADWLSDRRWGRALGYAFLAVSVLSVTYPAWNPWRHPWLYNLLDSQGWIEY